MADLSSLAGALLVAAPQLVDPHFRRAVVLVLQHDEDGALGMVLNRPLTVRVGTVLPGWDAVVSAPALLYRGGPVGLDGVLGLATMPAGADPNPAVSRMVGPFGLVDLETDPEQAATGITGLRLFAGHSGWSGGQLEGEVAVGGWHVLPALPSDAVTPAPEDLWRQVLRRQGGALAILSTFPEDPSLN